VRLRFGVPEILMNVASLRLGIPRPQPLVGGIFPDFLVPRILTSRSREDPRRLIPDDGILLQDSQRQRSVSKRSNR